MVDFSNNNMVFLEYFGIDGKQVFIVHLLNVEHNRP